MGRMFWFEGEKYEQIKRNGVIEVHAIYAPDNSPRFLVGEFAGDEYSDAAASRLIDEVFRGVIREMFNLEGQ